MADFPLRELDLPPVTLAALKTAGYNTFLDIIDLEREDLLRVDGHRSRRAPIEVLPHHRRADGGGARRPRSRRSRWPTAQELQEARELAAEISADLCPSVSWEARRIGRPDAPCACSGSRARAGAVVPGTERVREASRDRQPRFVLVAADASATTASTSWSRCSRRAVLPYAVSIRPNAAGRGGGPVAAFAQSGSSTRPLRRGSRR